MTQAKLPQAKDSEQSPELSQSSSTQKLLIKALMMKGSLIGAGSVGRLTEIKPKARKPQNGLIGGSTGEDIYLPEEGSQRNFHSVVKEEGRFLIKPMHDKSPDYLDVQDVSHQKMARE